MKNFPWVKVSNCKYAHSKVILSGLFLELFHMSNRIKSHEGFIKKQTAIEIKKQLKK